MVPAKNGEQVSIRKAELADAQVVLNIQWQTILENDYLITVPEEFNQTIPQQRDWIQKLLDNKRETMMVAEVDSIVVGWIVFQTRNPKRLAHAGTFGMMIAQEYRGIGIGKMLINALLDWAEKNPLIEKVSLWVISTNQRAIALYESFGFKEEGRKVREIKLDKTKYADVILMYRFV
ncbi:GNAT family N-acetyltransferase [Virgibacillus phasianinus]|uniref:GNAT family N-acetyltransferase n=2 Tax=Virgibacillus phasianinus TaxID=2017483 RepID=A0A220TY89_9BACI|nr:GNAT family N-acetyltransferase [Virgibacillus phasianinus]ASK60782.1 GNAT family N-acetyltransferase [Virgibacillus phasianinus]